MTLRTAMKLETPEMTSTMTKAMPRLKKVISAA